MVMMIRAARKRCTIHLLEAAAAAAAAATTFLSVFLATSWSCCRNPNRFVVVVVVVAVAGCGVSFPTAKAATADDEAVSRRGGRRQQQQHRQRQQKRRLAAVDDGMVKDGGRGASAATYHRVRTLPAADAGVTTASTLTSTTLEVTTNTTESSNTSSNSNSSTTLEDGNNSMNSTFTFSYQPRVTIVEGRPSRCGIASLSNPAGTPWCQGDPTYWVTGHQADHEIPRCFRNGSWVLSNTTELIHTRDRHFCVAMDVNRDGADDIICNVGAGQGKGRGYNELWITNSTTGAITQLLTASSVDNPYASPSGLQKYPTMRNRIATTLKNSIGETKFVFMGTLGEPRTDGMPDQHRMFKNVYTAPAKFPYFVEVPGPWAQQLFPTNGAVAGDFTGDGVDDLVVCNSSGPALLARQIPSDETFVKVRLPTNQPLLNYWIKARLADVTGDNRTDLVVVSSAATTGQTWYLTVFRGIRASPFFNFSTPYYRRQLSFAPMDVEVLDVNQDGKSDIYVVLVNNTKGAYCGPQPHVMFLTPDVVPPIDRAPDLLLVGHAVNATDPRQRFQVVTMQHAQPGCGAIAQRWDDQTMLLSQGSFNNAGYQLLLNW